MRRLRHLVSDHRTGSTNRLLGYLMAFNAGAINAGGFLVLQLYTSHMTGFVSMMADHLVLGNSTPVLAALGALLAFMAGAAVSAILMLLAQHWRLRSTYALPLIVVALLMLLFGLLGAATVRWQSWFAVPMTVLLLSFMMGLQNATLTRMSRASIRTTHMTGVVTDLGMELGRWLLTARGAAQTRAEITTRQQRLRLLLGLLGMFLCGGVAGAWGFQHWGFICVVPLAVVVLAVCLPPLWRDSQGLRQRMRARHTPNQH